MNMIEVKTQDLAGLALDWSVATATGCGDIVVKGDAITCIYEMSDGGGCWTNLYEPSRDWSQCGPLIEKSELVSARSGAWDGWHTRIARIHPRNGSKLKNRWLRSAAPLSRTSSAWS